MFTVNYLDVDRTGKSNTSVSSGQTTQSLSPQGSGSSSPETANAFSSGSDVAKNVSPASSVETKSKSDFWKDLNLTLSAIVGKADGRKIIINADAGIVLIRAYPNELQKAAKYMDYVQNSMTRQVIIDAKILEVRLDAGYQAGIDWTLFGNNVNQTANQEYTTGNSRINDGLKVFSQIFTLGAFYHHNSFSAVIQLLSTQGNIQILSSPRIATLNNQKAIIKVGQDEFFITNVENTTIGSGVSTENNQDIDLTPFFSGIALDVTPQISQSGEVILHIHPIISKVTDQNKKFVVSGQPQDLPLALSTIRESDSIVRAHSGQIVVIGGLMENATTETNASVPYLDKIKGMGPIFRRANQQATKTELVILLKPIVVGAGTWNKRLKGDAAALRNINRGFHFGPHPKIFGNLGEPTVQDELKKQKKPKPKPVKKAAYIK